MLDDDDPGEIRAVSAAVNYDGSLTLLLDVPGSFEPVEHTIPGNPYTVLLTWQATTQIDLHGTTSADRRCQELVARAVRRLNEDMARQRRAEERKWQEHQQREDDYGA